MRKVILKLALTLSIVTGMIWTVVVLALALFMGGWQMSNIRSGILSILGLGIMFVGPICLVTGGALGLLRKFPIAAFATSAIGAFSLSAVVGSMIHDQFHLNSAEIPSGFTFRGMFGSDVTCLRSTGH